jgi:hypothetical protein
LDRHHYLGLRLVGENNGFGHGARWICAPWPKLASLQAQARRRGLGRGRYFYAVMDGAVWLWDLAEDRFATAIKTLDFHHASQDLWAVGHALFGEATARG